MIRPVVFLAGLRVAGDLCHTSRDRLIADDVWGRGPILPWHGARPRPAPATQPHYISIWEVCVVRPRLGWRHIITVITHCLLILSITNVSWMWRMTAYLLGFHWQLYQVHGHNPQPRTRSLIRQLTMDWIVWTLLSSEKIKTFQTKTSQGLDQSSNSCEKWRVLWEL